MSSTKSIEPCRETSSSPSNAKKVFTNLDGNRLPTLKDIATLINQGKVNNVIIMAGAGISTSAGIPDFRSPGTGLYSNLEKYNLPYPEAIFEINYFKEHPEAFYALARELNPGNFKPTITHRFFRLLELKGILKRCFTQNIDTLERAGGVSDELVVEAHGSFASARCLRCGGKVSSDEFMDRLVGEGKAVVRCWKSSCEGDRKALVKPDIVFYGEGLPREFFLSLTAFKTADLLIVLGTSLQVHPFASLIGSVPQDCPRVLINLEAVGEIGKGEGGGGGEEGFDFEGRLRGGREFVRDVLYLGTTDDAVRELSEMLGWTEELLDLHDPSRHQRPTNPNPETLSDSVTKPDLSKELNRDHRIPDDTASLTATNLSTGKNIGDQIDEVTSSIAQVSL